MCTAGDSGTSVAIRLAAHTTEIEGSIKSNNRAASLIAVAAPRTRRLKKNLLFRLGVIDIARNRRAHDPGNAGGIDVAGPHHAELAVRSEITRHQVGRGAGGPGPGDRIQLVERDQRWHLAGLPHR